MGFLDFDRRIYEIAPIVVAYILSVLTKVF